MDRLEAAYGKLLEALALAACALVLRHDADDLRRRAAAQRAHRPGHRAGWRGRTRSPKAMLYLITMLTAPWLLRRGQHIRVDIVLRAVPKRLGWIFEWIVDLLGLACCLVIAWLRRPRRVSPASSAGSMSIKTLVTPEWWLLSALPVAFLALSIEMLFRMRRLRLGERAPRDDAVSTG